MKTVFGANMEGIKIELSKNYEEEFAEVAYDGYCESSGYKSKFTGADLPSWDDVDEDIKEHWRAAVRSIFQSFRKTVEFTIPVRNQ